MSADPLTHADDSQAQAVSQSSDCPSLEFAAGCVIALATIFAVGIVSAVVAIARAL